MKQQCETCEFFDYKKDKRRWVYNRGNCTYKFVEPILPESVGHIPFRMKMDPDDGKECRCWKPKQKGNK